MESRKLSLALIVLLLMTFINSQAFAFDPKTFKKPTKAELKKKLTAISFVVTQEDGTERPFKNEFNDN